ncbi:hypothetical protein BC828DRAFT_27048 [Blastocladiella britannica]|nr:hypothetical protein BC828DRAFT_27048 [Blastocladiella britannica]
MGVFAQDNRDEDHGQEMYAAMLNFGKLADARLEAMRVDIADAFKDMANLESLYTVTACARTTSTPILIYPLTRTIILATMTVQMPTSARSFPSAAWTGSCHSSAAAFRVPLHLAQNSCFVPLPKTVFLLPARLATPVLRSVWSRRFLLPLHRSRSILTSYETLLHTLVRPVRGTCTMLLARISQEHRHRLQETPIRDLLAVRFGGCGWSP